MTYRRTLSSKPCPRRRKTYTVYSTARGITDGINILDEAFACFKAAYDTGINFFDTAENYSAGQAEVILGQAIKKFGWKQNDLVISTKVKLTLYTLMTHGNHTRSESFLSIC